MQRSMRWLMLAALSGGACTRESVRVAIDAQRRADEVQQGVIERQHDGLRVLLYRDLASRLEAASDTLNEAQKAALNEAWNERDLMEFWLLQNERARALRMAGVDSKLYSDQSTADLLVKSLFEGANRLQQGLAAQAGRNLGPPPAAPDAATAGAGAAGGQ